MQDMKVQDTKENTKLERCYTYMVRCADHSLYTGWTVDLEKRVAAHNSGQGAIRPGIAPI